MTYKVAEGQAVMIGGRQYAGGDVVQPGVAAPLLEQLAEAGVLVAEKADRKGRAEE